LCAGPGIHDKRKLVEAVKIAVAPASARSLLWGAGSRTSAEIDVIGKRHLPRKLLAGRMLIDGLRRETAY